MLCPSVCHVMSCDDQLNQMRKSSFPDISHPDLHNIKESFLPRRPFFRHLCEWSDKIQTHAAEGGLNDDHDEAGRDLPHSGDQTHWGDRDAVPRAEKHRCWKYFIHCIHDKLFVRDTWGCKDCSSFAEIFHPPGDAISGLWVGSPGPGEECAPHLVHGFARSLVMFGHPQLTGTMYLLHTLLLYTTAVQAQCLILARKIQKEPASRMQLSHGTYIKELTSCWFAFILLRVSKTTSRSENFENQPS